MKSAANRLVYAGAWALFACSGEPAATEAGADVAETAPTCHQKQKKSDGSCCQAGHFYDFQSDTCAPVGPPECAENIFTNPEKCLPKWCWDWQDSDSNPCPAWSDGCETVGRLCSSAEISAGAGCRAGSFPFSGNVGDCAPAGYFSGSGVPRDWDGELAALPAVPPLQDSIAVGVPPLTTLADVDNQFFCIDEKTKASRFCTQSEMKVCHRGPKGALPDATKCVYVGVSWPRVCPPGFVVDEKSPVAAGILPPCLPDPADCGAGPWPEVGAATAVLYVSAETGDDAATGSADKPLKSIGKALKLAPSGGAVAVAVGTYDEKLSITKSLTIRGRCAALVEVNGLLGATVLHVGGDWQGNEVFVEGVRFGGKSNGIEVSAGHLHFRRAVVAGQAVAGVFVHGPQAIFSAESVVVQGTQPRSSDNTLGRGIAVDSAGQLSLTDTRLTGNHDNGLSADDFGTIVAANRLLVDNTLPNDQKSGRGIVVQNGPNVTLQSTRVTGSRELGLFITGAKSGLNASRLLIDGTLARQSDKKFGVGISARKEAQVTLQDTVLSGNRDVGVAVDGAKTTLSAERLLVAGTRSQESSQMLGNGVSVFNGAQVTLQDVRLSGNRDAGLAANNYNTTVTATRLLVDATLPEELDKQAGVGVAVAHGAEIVLQAARLTGNCDVGLYAGNTGTSLDAAGIVIDGTLPRGSDAKDGRGADFEDGAAVLLRDARISGSRTVGLFVTDTATTLEATHLLVEATGAQASDGQSGQGVGVQNGAKVKFDQVRLSLNRNAGLLVDGDKSTVTANGLLVDGTLSQQNDKMFGRGVSAQRGAMLHLQGSRIVGNRELGLSAMLATVGLIGVIIAETLPSDADQTGGGGLWLLGNSTASIVASAFTGNIGVGLVAYSSTVVAQNLLLLSTHWGKYPLADPAGSGNETTPLADGILLKESPHSQIKDCIFMGNDRAGILVETSSGAKLTGNLVHASNGLYGLVLQNSIDTVDQFNAIFGAKLHDRVSDAGLLLPKPPQAVQVIAAQGGKTP